MKFPCVTDARNSNAQLAIKHVANFILFIAHCPGSRRPKAIARGQNFTRIEKELDKIKSYSLLLEKIKPMPCT
jgi:hypothetical protein